MVSRKPWKLDALLRLAVGMLLSTMFAGTIAGAIVRFFQDPARPDPWPFILAGTGATVSLLVALVLLYRPWRIETPMRRIFALVGCLYATVFLTWLTLRFSGNTSAGSGLSTSQIIVAVLAFQGVALVLVHLFLREHGMGWSEAFGFGHDWSRALLIGVAVGCAVIPVLWSFQVLSGLLMDQFNVSAPAQEAVQAVRASTSWQNRLVLGLTAIVLAPVAEEVLFRGILYPAIKQWGYPRLALWGTSIIFGLVHYNLMTFLPLTLLGLGLVWIFERTDNLLAPIVTHSFFNTVNFILLLSFDAVDRLPLGK